MKARKPRKRKEKMGPKGKVVMKEFEAGRLRSSSGQKVTNPEQAVAIAYSEQRAAKKRGTSKRTWKGRTRTRPHLKGSPKAQAFTRRKKKG